MLEQLFGSRTRVKLLALFLRHPEEPMYVRELTRRIETQINAVRRELANLVKVGLVVETVSNEEESDTDGKKRAGVKRRYYMTNRAFPLLPEITSLIIKSQLLLERQLDREILKLGDVRFLALFGFFIGKPRGPVDLFIVGDVPKEGLQTLIGQLEKDLGSEINFSLMGTEEFRYRKEIMDRFLLSILDAPKTVVIDRLNERA